MKTTLLCLLLLFTGIAGAQIVNIPDANFKAKLLSAATNNAVASGIDGSIVIDVNEDGEIQVSEAARVYGLNVSSANIQDLTGIESFTNLTILECQYNQLQTFDASPLPILARLYCYNNQLTNLNVANNLGLQILFYGNNPLGNLYLNNLAELVSVDCSSTNVTTLDLSGCPLISWFAASNNALLTSINLKNGTSLSNLTDTYVGNSPNLAFICVDEGEINSLQDYANNLGISSTTVLSTYCSFTPGGDYNTITGTLRFDGNNDGCDAADATQSFIKVKIEDGTNTGYTFTNNAGQFMFYTQAGTFNVTAEFEDNQFFIASPASAQVVFPVVDNSVATENFCVTANGMHPDVEVVMVPVSNARPGFDALYKIVYKNKGNQVLSGRVSCGWDTSVLSPVLLDPFPNGMAPDAYSWDYTNLQPFESREILMTLNVNSPTEVPAVNDGDVLPFIASVNSGYADETPDDNYYEFNQTVVNSLDPNNIVCVEGDTESPDAIGNYLHYVVNFENTGTAPAEFVVITHDIDPAEFDVNTVEILNASHDVRARLSGNRIEFAFAGIQLGVAAHGNILFKLKSRASLQQGDIVVNRANIFFDYNSPLATNDARTVFALLSTGNFAKDASVQVYPNPAKNTLTVKADSNIQSLQLYDIQGRLLQTNLVNDTLQLLDISSRTSGLYFIKVTTDKGVSVEKVIKE